jgi:hypothetical protein
METIFGPVLKGAKGAGLCAFGGRLPGGIIPYFVTE